MVVHNQKQQLAPFYRSNYANPIFQFCLGVILLMGVIPRENTAWGGHTAYGALPQESTAWGAIPTESDVFDFGGENDTLWMMG